MPGFDIHVSQPIIESVTDRIFDVHSQLVVRIFGDDFNELRRIGNDIITVLKAVPGTADVAFDIDQAAAPAAAHDQGRSRRGGALRHQCRGRVRPDPDRNRRRWVSQVFIGERRYDTTVRFPETTRDNPEAIGNLPLTSSERRAGPLSQVARIQLQLGESTITRWMNQRSVTVKLNYADRDLPSLMAEAQKRPSPKRVAFDPQKISHRMGRGFRKPAAGRSAFRLILGLVLG